MKKTKLLALSTLAIAVSPYAMSAGFQVSEHSASGLGRAYAGEAAMTDNAAVIARNPAAMSYFDKQSVSIVGHYIDPNIDVDGTNTSANPAVPVADASDKDIAPSAFVPGAFYILPIDDKWAFGLALTSHFGLSSEYSSSYGGSEYAGKASIESIYLTPQVSYKITDAITAGLGVSYITGKGELSNSASSTLAITTGCTVPAPTCIPTGTTLLDLEADGDGFGWNLGLMWQLNEKARIGLRYMAAVDLDTDADYTLASLGPAKQTGTLTFNLPEVAEVSYSQIIGEKWLLAASIQHTGWSSFESLKVDDLVLKEENWEDAMRYSLGVDYALNEKVTLRVGYAYDESPVGDENRTLSIPDADRNWLSFGGTFALETGSIDAGFTYINGKTVDVNEEFKSPSSGATLTSFEGELSKTDAFIYSIGYNVSF